MEKIKAVIYARYSSHNQREESIEGQLRRCHEFAEQNGFVVIHEYCDRALSGKTDNRPEFQQMIKDSEKRQFKAIIMYTLDRFARNRQDSAMYKARLKMNGVKLYYTEQQLTDDPESSILEAVLEGLAEYYSRNLSRGVVRGMRENVLKGMVNGGKMPLGYRKSADNKFEIDPATALIVQEIFDLYASGKSQSRIVEILNEKGYRTSRDRPFRIGGISSILKNRKYTGVYTFQDMVVEDCVPVIISKDLFERVQEKMSHNKRNSGRMKAPEQYLLTGKLFCGNCGSSMVGESGTSGTGAIYNYYKCSSRKKHKDCNKENEKKAFIERLVVSEVIKRILEPGNIEEIAKRVAEIAKKEFEDKSRLEALVAEKKEVENSIKNLLKLVEKGIDTDDVGERLLSLNSQKVDLIKQISREECEKPMVDESAVVYWLRDFTKGDINDIEYQQRVIDALVNKVFIFDEDGGGRKIVILCNTSSREKISVSLSDVKSSDITSSAVPKKKTVHILNVDGFLCGLRRKQGEQY